MFRLILPIVLAVLLTSSAVTKADEGLKPVADALAAIRGTHGVNEMRDAGPELTPIKQRLHAWVDKTIATMTRDSDEGAAAKQLSAAIEAAGLTCDDGPKGSKKCGSYPDHYSDFDARGYLGNITMSHLDYGRYLLVEADVGVRCGYDQSAYLYEWRDDRWRLLLQSEQDDYGKDSYKVQNILSFQVSPADIAWNEPAKPPLVMSLGYSPWCQSNWQMLYTRIWHTSLSDLSPLPLVETTDSLYMGDDPAVATGSIVRNDILIEFRGQSIDGDKLIRPVVRHYLVHDDDSVERVAPLAISPTDFVEEWLGGKWEETANWTDNSGDRIALEKWHSDLTKELGEFEGPPTRCRADPTLWQVGFPETAYFLVRWLAPYQFSVVKIQKQAFAHCDVKDNMPDNFGTLFPMQGWRQ